MGMKLQFLFTILIVSLTSSSAQNPKLFTYSDENFNQTHLQFFTNVGDGQIDQGALQLTPDSLADWFNLLNKSGRVMFTRPFKLWEETSLPPSNNDVVASFNSTFDINVFPANQTADPDNTAHPGEGLAFVIAPDLEVPSNSHGEWLGLTNATLNGVSSNKFVAIEFDTVKQSYDPDNNHMGLNINSVQSNKTVPLSQFNITIAPRKATFWTVWVQYNGSSKVLEVYMANRDNASKPMQPILREVINLREYVNQNSYMGFSGSTGSTAELNCILRWDLRVEILPEGKDWTWLKILVGVGVPVVALLVAFAVALWCYLQKKKATDDNNRILLGALKKLPGTPTEFRFKELKEATNNFDEKMKLGEGGFGVVYKGVLVKEKVEVAVKKFSRESMKSKEDFLAELTIINRIRHKHLVRLVGWCHKTGMLLLVYEYMPNGSVDDHLFSGPDKFLTWTQRYNIISGLASALHYLHNEYDQKVIHRDIKSSNILLDSDYNARLGDFGLARAIEHGRTSYAELEGVPGTIGYIAPETFHAGKATRESDVFAFGAVVLEVVCGQRPWTKIDSLVLVDWVWKLHREGRIVEAVDDRLGKDYVVDEAMRLLLLGLACCHPIAYERPNTQMIFQIVSGSVPAPKVPNFKPAFMWPVMGSTEGDSSMSNNYSSMSNNYSNANTTTTDTTPITSSYYGGSGGGSSKFLSRESYDGPPVVSP